MTSHDPHQLTTLRAALTERAGGYLRNPIREPGLTCTVCTGPSNGFELCFQCRQHRQIPGAANIVGSMTYAIAGRQSGYAMRGYKTPVPVPEHRGVVTMLVRIGLALHLGCVEGLLNVPITHWSSVPSLPARAGEHPLHMIVGDCARTGALSHTAEAPLRSAAVVANPRSVTPDHFSLEGTLSSDSHVLLVDDTWVSGGHAQSAALALRRAGAGRVSVLAIARWLRPARPADEARHDDLLRRLRDRDYDPSICPWSAQHCAPPTA